MQTPPSPPPPHSPPTLSCRGFPVMEDVRSFWRGPAGPRGCHWAGTQNQRGGRRREREGGGSRCAEGAHGHFMEDAHKGARGAQWARHSNMHLRGSVGTGEPVRCCSGGRTVCVLSRVRPSVTPWTAAFQTPLSMGFSRQEYWSGVPLPSPSIPTNVVYFYIFLFTKSHFKTV